MVAIQGIFYCIPFYITWTPTLVCTFLHQILGIPVIYTLYVVLHPGASARILQLSRLHSPESHVILLLETQGGDGAKS